MKNLSDQELLEKAEAFLKTAESRYGPRNSEWKIRAVLRNKKPSPYTSLSNKECEIWIGTPSTDADYLWEIGQEVIHCIDPHDPKRILKLEEGVSMVFGMALAGPRPISGEYSEAYDKTNKLLTEYPNCVLDIRTKYKCTISAITFDMLREAAPKFPEADAKLLTDFFSYGRSQSELDALR